MRLILLGAFSFGKMWENIEKLPFFWAATSGLEKYCMGLRIDKGSQGVLRCTSKLLISLLVYVVL